MSQGTEPSGDAVANPYTRSTNFGRTENTIQGDQPAISLYQFWRQFVEPTTYWNIENIPYEDIQGDNLEVEFLDFASWLTRTPIPSKWQVDGGEMIPAANHNDENPVQIIRHTTLSKYIGRVLAFFRRKFPRHDDFVNLKKNEVPEWWTRMRSNFESQCEHMHMKLGSDYNFGASKTLPLYFENRSTTRIFSESAVTDTNDFLSVIDLKYILRSLLKKAIKVGHTMEGPLLKRAYLSILYHSSGRPGEVKFVDIKRWCFDHGLDVFDTQWIEPKTSRIQSMPMVIDAENWENCIYHAIASFFAVEDGLFRDSESMKCATRLFPMLNSLMDNNISKKIAATIRDNLPPDCPKELKNNFSGKSIRQSTITTIITHSEGTYKDAACRSGHDTGTSLDSYADKLNPAFALRGARILAHHSPNADVRLPRLDFLPQDSVNRMLEKLFIVDVPAFQSGGNLHHLLRVFFAVLIMQHNRVLKEMGSDNAIVMKLEQAARSASITDPDYPYTAPEVIVSKWSDTVCVRYKTLNPGILKATDNGSNLALVLNQLSDLSIATHADVKVLLNKIQENEGRISAQERMMSDMYDQIKRLTEDKEELQQQVVKLSTPPASPDRKRKKQSQKEESSNSSMRSGELSSSSRGESPSVAAGTSSSVAVGASSSLAAGGSGSVRGGAIHSVAVGRSGRDGVAAPSKLTQHTVYMRQRDTTTATKKKQSTKGVSMTALLVDLSIKGTLQGLKQWKNASIDKDVYGQVQSAKNVLELCQYVCEMKDGLRDEMQVLKDGKNGDRRTLTTAAKTIEIKAFKQMYAFEGKADPEAEYLANSKSGSRNKVPTYHAVGTRVMLYKRFLSRSEKKEMYNGQPLIERPGV